MKIQELRDLSIQELEKLLEDKKQALFNLRFQKAKGTLENTNMLKNTKVDIARIYTLLKSGSATATAVNEPPVSKPVKAKKSEKPISELGKEKKSAKPKKSEKPISQSVEETKSIEPISESEKGDN